jgi:hypothetical protein
MLNSFNASAIRRSDPAPSLRICSMTGKRSPARFSAFAMRTTALAWFNSAEPALEARKIEWILLTRIDDQYRPRCFELGASTFG